MKNTKSPREYQYISTSRELAVVGMRWFVNHVPYFLGRNRTARFFAQIVLPRNVCALTHTHHDKILLDIRNSHEVSMYFDTFDKKFSDLLAEVLKPGDAFIDCGANVGYFTFLAASLVKSNGCVLSFEPNPICCGRIEASIEVGGYDNIHLVRGAVSDANTEMSFNIAADPMYSSFSDVDQLSFATLEKTISVPVLTIDSVIGTHCSDAKRIRLIKIDVEGAELEALRGMSETLERKAYDYIYGELHPQQLANRNIDINEVRALLEKYGYRDKNWGQPRRILYSTE